MFFRKKEKGGGGDKKTHKTIIPQYPKSGKGPRGGKAKTEGHSAPVGRGACSLQWTSPARPDAARASRRPRPSFCPNSLAKQNSTPHPHPHPFPLWKCSDIRNTSSLRVPKPKGQPGREALPKPPLSTQCLSDLRCEARGGKSAPEARTRHSELSSGETSLGCVPPIAPRGFVWGARELSLIAKSRLTFLSQTRRGQYKSLQQRTGHCEPETALGQSGALKGRGGEGPWRGECDVC